MRNYLLDLPDDILDKILRMSGSICSFYDLQLYYFVINKQLWRIDFKPNIFKEEKAEELKLFENKEQLNLYYFKN